MEKNETGMCQEFCLLNSKIQTIWKDRTKIVSAFEKKWMENKAILKAWMKWR
jgi:hypothetical protein